MVVYTVAAIPIHVILSHTGIPIALKITFQPSLNIIRNYGTISWMNMMNTWNQYYTGGYKSMHR